MAALSQPTYSQTPKVPAEQKSDGSVKTESETTHHTRDARDVAPSPPQVLPERSDRKGDRKGAERGEETSENWIVVGVRARSGEWLLIVVTFLLFLATVALWLSTRSLVRDAGSTSRRQLRAYLFIDDTRRTRRGDGDPWEVHLQIKNSGQTPAYKVRVFADYRFVDKGDADAFGFPPPIGGGAPSDLGPSQPLLVTKRIPELAGQLWDDFKAGRKVLYVWGRIEFVDAFGAKRWVRFRLGQDGGYLRNLMHCRDGNDTSESVEDEK